MKNKLIKRITVFTIILIFVFANALVVFGEQSGGGTDPQCTSGGVGSTSCEGEWTVLGVSTSCSVTCGSGYYACCYLSAGVEARCVCKSNSGDAK